VNDVVAGAAGLLLLLLEKEDATFVAMTTGDHILLPCHSTRVTVLHGHYTVENVTTETGRTVVGVSPIHQCALSINYLHSRRSQQQRVL
jgi:hypothetical protein